MNLTDETLSIFRDFVRELGPVSARLGEKIEATGAPIEMTPFLNGIETLAESVPQIQMALELEGSCIKESHDQELMDLMHDLLTAIRTEDLTAQSELLKGEFPTHLKKWESIEVIQIPPRDVPSKSP